MEPGTELRLCSATWSRLHAHHRDGAHLPDELEMAAASIEDPAVLGYFIASTTRIKTEEKQEPSKRCTSRRLHKLTALMNRELRSWSWAQDPGPGDPRWTELARVCAAAQPRPSRTSWRDRRDQAEINELRESIDKAGLPEEVDKQARRELTGSRSCPGRSRVWVIRTYLDWIVSLP